MPNRYINDTLTSSKFCESVKMGSKVIQNYGGVSYRKNFKISRF